MQNQETSNVTEVTCHDFDASFWLSEQQKDVHSYAHPELRLSYHGETTVIYKSLGKPNYCKLADNCYGFIIKMDLTTVRNGEQLIQAVKEVEVIAFGEQNCRRLAEDVQVRVSNNSVGFKGTRMTPPPNYPFSIYRKDKSRIDITRMWLSRFDFYPRIRDFSAHLEDFDPPIFGHKSSHLMPQPNRFGVYDSDTWGEPDSLPSFFSEFPYCPFHYEDLRSSDFIRLSINGAR